MHQVRIQMHFLNFCNELQPTQVLETQCKITRKILPSFVSLNQGKTIRTFVGEFDFFPPSIDYWLLGALV